MNRSCIWHKDEQPVSKGIGCDCGSMLATRDCSNCRRTFLDWDSQEHDDVMAAPYATSSGDLACWSCGPQMERRRERAIEEEFCL